MVRFVNLKKSSFESAKLGVKKSKLYGEKKFKELSKLSFDEILKFMEEHDFKNAIDTSYLQFEGFSLIEKVLNMHTSRIYKEVFGATSKQNKVLLETYYLKYQIHNLMALVRCRVSNEKDLEIFLIGDERKKSKFLKAFEMQNLEDAIEYISKKLNFDFQKVIESFNKGIYYMENYLYKEYYNKLGIFRFKFNNLDEIKFFDFLKKYVDLLNSRIFLRLKVEDTKDFDFKEIFVEGGNLSMNFFENLKLNKVSEILSKLNDEFGNIDDCSENACVASIDKRINIHKSEGRDVLRIASFGSPFYTLKYLFNVENESAKLRILLKGKYLNLDDKEISSLMGF